MEGHSCAFLETVVNEAGLAAGFDRAESIELRHFIKAYARTEGQELMSAPDASEAAELDGAGESERAQVAYHEAGHVVALEQSSKNRNS